MHDLAVAVLGANGQCPELEGLGGYGGDRLGESEWIVALTYGRIGAQGRTKTVVCDNASRNKKVRPNACGSIVLSMTENEASNFYTN